MQILKERARARMLRAKAKGRKAVPRMLQVLREVGTQACRLQQTHEGGAAASTTAAKPQP